MKYILILIALLSVGCADIPIPSDAHYCFDNSVSDAEKVVIESAWEEWRLASNGRVQNTEGNRVDCYSTFSVMPVVIYEGTGEDVEGVTFSDGSQVQLQRYDLSNAEDFDHFYVNALHEIGHLVTGHGHSSNTNDVMYLHYDSSHHHLTCNDINRLDSVD